MNIMIDRRKETSRLRQILTANRFASIGTSVLSFTMTTIIVYYFAKLFGGNDWFSVIYGIAVGMLFFCAAKVWLDEGSFDSPESKSYVILTGTLSFIGMILAYITLGTYPFGEHTVLIIDMHHQYVAFFSLMREKLTTGGSLLYSDSLGLGSGWLPLCAYYLSSPFNIIALIFPRENLTEAIELITLLKITTSGVTFAIFARKMFRRNDFFIVAGGVMYSLMSFMVCHSWNVMWLDPLILLPLLFLGLNYLLKDGKPLLYCVALALTLITNYYIGYMICVFMVVCYVANAVADTRRLTAVERVQRFWRFCYGSLIGGGISAITIIPTFIYLQQTSGAEDRFARDVASNFELFSLIQRSLYGSYPSMRGDNLPNIYCTVFAFFLFFLFAFCRSISMRKRIAWCGAAAFIALCMSINWTNFAWHGFHFPNDLPYRFSFLLSFCMIYIAMMLLNDIDRVQPKEVVAAALTSIGLILMEEKFGDGKASFAMLYGSIAFILAYAAIFAFKSAGRMRKAVCYALVAAVVFAEAASNASILLTQLDENEYYTEREDFVYDYEIDNETFRTIESYGDDMYREELLPRKTCNDPSLFGYNGLTAFASSNSKSITTLMGKLGYAVNGVNSYLYKNFVPVSDSILGLKYLALNKEMTSHEQLTPIETVEVTKEVDGIEQTEYRFIHENESALSRAFMVNRSIVGWDWENNNPFIVQNSLLSTMSGVDDVYTPIYLYTDDDYSYEYDNFDEYYSDDEIYAEGEDYEEYDEYYEEEDSLSDANTDTDDVNCTVDINGTYFCASKVNEEIDLSFTSNTVIGEAGQYYAYIDCRAAESISVSTRFPGSVDSTTISASHNEPNIIDLGRLKEGSTVSVFIHSEISCGGNIFLARLNEEVFDTAIERLSASQLDAEVCKEGKIKGTVTAEKSGMMFTSIPYDSGWTVKVDGKKTPTFALGEALLCFAVPEGTHTVAMTYFPSGFAAGIVITVIALMLLLLLVVPKWRAWAEKLLSDCIRRQRKKRAVKLLRTADENAADAVAESAFELMPDSFDDDIDTEISPEAGFDSD